MLNLLVDSWNHSLTELAIIILRLLFVPLLLYNMAWSFKGAIHFFKTRSVSVYTYKSMIFLASAGMLLRQILFFTGYPNESVGPVALLALCFMILSSILAALTHAYNLVHKLDTFYWLTESDSVDLALRTVELARFDKGYIDRLLQSAEGTIAMRLTNKVLSKND